MRDRIVHRVVGAGRGRQAIAAAVLVALGSVAGDLQAQVCEPEVVYRGGVVEGSAGRFFTNGTTLILPSRDDPHVVAPASRITIYDVRDAAAPVLLTEFEVEQPWAAWVGSDLAIVTGGGVAGPGYLATFDISDPSSPTPLGETALAGIPVAFAVSGGVAFVSLRDVGLAAVDIAEPGSPALVGVLEISGFLGEVAVEGDVALITTRREGVHVIDISDPGAMVEVATLPTATLAFTVAVQGGLAAVGTKGGLLLADVSDPRSPAPLGTFESVGEIHDVVMAAPLVLAGALRPSEVVVIDVDDPASPTERGRTPFPAPGTIVALPALGLNGKFVHFVHHQLRGALDISTFEFGTLDISLCQCYADCNGSGELDVFDFLCFQNVFAAASPLADCDRSGELDVFDFLCFQNEFAAGCP
jgi:hypothetical protein